jgi:hypothetical protein
MTEDDAIVEHARDMQRHFTAIGHFIKEFSQLEFTIKARLSAHFGQQCEDFIVIIDNVEVLKLIDGWQRLTRHKNSNADTVKSVDDACAEFRTLNDLRNRIAHGLWASDLSLTFGVGKRPNKKGEHKKTWSLQNPNDIRLLVDRCQALLQTFMTLPTL